MKNTTKIPDSGFYSNLMQTPSGVILSCGDAIFANS
jgi:hypothetical protein